jgi:hypothetical protein
MKIFTKLLAASAIAVAMLFTGCKSGPLLLLNPEVEFPVDITAEAPAFVVPISLHFSGTFDKDKVELALTGGMAAQFKGAVISGQQAYDMVGNLSWSLGENMRRNAQNEKWVMSGYAKDNLDELNGLMSGITDLLSTLGLVEPGFEFQYAIVLHADSEGMRLPKTTSFVAFGGLVDLKTGQIMSYIEKQVRIADNSATALAQIPMEFNKIIETLMVGDAVVTDEETTEAAE